MSSIFDAPTKEQETETSQETQTTEDWVQDLVTEKGEQWSDPQVIAKGYAHAQKRIKELEELSKAAEQNDYAKQLLEQLQSKQATEATTEKTEPEIDPGSTEQKDHTSLSPEDIESLLEAKLSSREKSNKVEKALRDKFGDSANVIVHKRAEELGLSIDKMQEIAQESPDAFLRLVGEPKAKETNTQVKSSVNSAAGFNSNSGERDHKYYSNLRRTNRKLYDSMQAQMLQDRMKLGDAFYNN